MDEISIPKIGKDVVICETPSFLMGMFVIAYHNNRDTADLPSSGKIKKVTCIKFRTKTLANSYAIC